MKTYILGDNRKEFLNDIDTSMMLESYPFAILKASNIEDVKTQNQKNPMAILILSDTLLEQTNVEALKDLPQCYGYSTTPNGDNYLASLPIKIQSLGLCRTSQDLLTALCNEPLQVVGNSTSSTTKQSSVQQINQPQQSTPITPVTNTAPAPQTAGPQVVTQLVQPEVNQPTQPAINMTPEMMAQMIQLYQMINQQGAVQPIVNSAASPQSTTQTTTKIVQPIVETPPTSTSQPMTNVSVGEQIRQEQAHQTELLVDRLVDNDLATVTPKTVVTSVYAAKGGVGKTTISTELAVCLALTSNGRRKFRVCIVDYNIDFGDVSTTLGLDENGPTLSYWSSVIKEMLDSGKAPEDINFTKEEMENYYLQKMDKTDLYALCAPVSHADSMLVQATELDIMLRNIIENGGFDYVICDTGNNTRDSSIIALDKSDYVLLVATQDVTTANCNASVLTTLQNARFETDKIRLIINNVMPSKDTGLKVELVEEAFPYQCICRIKRTPDVIKANNLKRPLVYKPNHEYTKQIQKIVKFITNGIATEEETSKKSFSFFKRKHNKK